MKKIIYFTLLLIVASTCSKINNHAYAEQNHFAQIVQSDTYIYKNTNKEKLFLLPKSYFVTLLDESQDMYKINYNGIIGYVEKNRVSCVLNSPQNLYPKRQLRIFSSDGCIIYKLPTTNSSVLGTAPLKTYIDFYGSMYGEEYVEGRGSDWYYISYTINGEKIYGYVYGGYCDNITKLLENTESVTYIENINFSNNSKISTATPTQISITTALVSLSCLVVLLMLFLPTFIKRSVTKNKEKQIISSYYNDNEF